MAGMIALILFLLVQCEVYEINAKECPSNGVVLHCSWRGKGKYMVSAVLTQETLEFNKMMSRSNLLVSRMFLWNLRKVEIKQEDISCGEIKAPSDVTI